MAIYSLWRHELRDAVVGGIHRVSQRASRGRRSSAAWLLNPAIYALGQTANYSNCFHDIATGNQLCSAGLMLRARDQSWAATGRGRGSAVSQL